MSQPTAEGAPNPPVKGTRTWLSDGLLVSLVTALAYVMGFAHEVGIAWALGIPVELIDLQLMPALYRTLASLAFILCFFQLAYPLIDQYLMPSSRDTAATRLTKLAASLAVLILTFRLVGGSYAMPLRKVAIALIPVAGFLLVGLLSRKYVGSPAERLFDFLRDDALRREPIYTPVLGPVGEAGGKLSMLALLFTALSLAAGFGGGKRQDAFFVTDGRPERVVLRIYGDRVITADFARAEKKIGRRYQVTKIDTAGLVLRQEKVGPLWVEP